MVQDFIMEQLIAQMDAAGVDYQKKDKAFFDRLKENAGRIHFLFHQLYGYHHDRELVWNQLIMLMIQTHLSRPKSFKKKDQEKQTEEKWFLSNKIAGMSLYVDRFCGKISDIKSKLPYLKELGINFLHLMPLFESPEGESDGGYAVSDFRKVDERFGSLEDLKKLRSSMDKEQMYLMIDIVLNHTSYHHEWAKKAKAGDPYYQQYYYMYDNREIPDAFDRHMPEIFPESAPGSFSFVPECNKWVMSVFHNYQWDLNFGNPVVFREMLDNIFFYANLGVDILRIDAPAFIWKEMGTTCQNLPQAHTLLRLIKQCVEVAVPGMALLGEAIVAPKEIMKYFGTDDYIAKECDFAYNATHMALQWDMLATGDTRVMLQAQHEILQKPYGTSWITYTRCHDDIGLGYDDYMIRNAGYDPYEHRKFLKDFYSGNLPYSPSAGALFSSNPKTGDARISGSLASLCGLEKAIHNGNAYSTDLAIRRILLMQAHSFLLGGIPMLFYGDEAGYSNDYSYLSNPGKSYDNRWMHRPIIDWNKNEKVKQEGSTENLVYTGTQKLLSIRKSMPVFSDHKNLTWLTPHNPAIAGFLRHAPKSNVFCLFNFSDREQGLTWYAFKEKLKPSKLYDHWSGTVYNIGHDHHHFILMPYGFAILEVVE